MHYPSPGKEEEVCSSTHPLSEHLGTAALLGGRRVRVRRGSRGMGRDGCLSPIINARPLTNVVSPDVGLWWLRSKRERPNTALGYVGVSCAQVTQLKQMADRVKVGYTATAVGIHCTSRLQLREAQHACDAALAAAERRRAGRCNRACAFRTLYELHIFF